MIACETPTSIYFFFNDTAPAGISTLPPHAPLRTARCRRRRPPLAPTSPSWPRPSPRRACPCWSRTTRAPPTRGSPRSEEHTSELQSRQYLVCRLLLEKKKCRPIHVQRHHTTPHVHL